MWSIALGYIPISDVIAPIVSNFFTLTLPNVKDVTKHWALVYKTHPQSHMEWTLHLLQIWYTVRRRITQTLFTSVLFVFFHSSDIHKKHIVLQP